MQQLKVQLDEEQGNLEEQQYSRYIDDQKEILGTIYENYESALDSYLDNAVKVIADSIATVNAGTSEINDTIKDKVESVGYELSDKIENIWNRTSVFKEGFKGVKDSVDDEKGILSDFRLENAELINAQKDAITTALQNLLAQEGLSNLTEANIKTDTSDIRSGVYTANGWLETIAKNTTPTLNSTDVSDIITSSSGSDDGIIYSSNGNVYKPLPSDSKAIISNKSGMFTSTPTTVQTILKDSAYVPAPNVKTNTVGNTIENLEVNTNLNVEVEDYKDFVKQLQADKKFEKVIVDITSSALTGSSSLSKYRHQLK